MAYGKPRTQALLRKFPRSIPRGQLLFPGSFVGKSFRAYFSRFHTPRRLTAGCSARRGLRRVVILHKQAATRQCARRQAALRVGAGRGVCGVVPLANGMTIGCTVRPAGSTLGVRLASIRVQLQREI